jgi:hypothetical protein
VKDAPMEITFNLPHVFNPKASSVDNAYALRALLDCMIELNLAYLQSHSVPALYQAGVRYGRTKIWEPIPALYLPNKFKRKNLLPGGQVTYVPAGLSGGVKKGDCKSLAPALIAELTMKGVACRPVFRFIEREDGSGIPDFHILVQTPASKTGWMDPSKDLGMGKEELNRFYGPNSYGFEL